jgi:hypothetical protein
VNKKAICRALYAFNYIYANIIYITSYSINSKNYNTLLIDDVTSAKWGYTYTIKSKAFKAI